MHDTISCQGLHVKAPLLYASWRFAQGILTMQVSAGYHSVLIQRGGQGTVKCGGHAQ